MTHPAAGGRPERAAASPTALLVLGMHRSGTSALARVLDLLGAALGEALAPAHGSNGAGCGEHAEIVRVHDELLDTLGSRWDDPRPLPAEVLRGGSVRPFRDRLRAVVERDFTGRALWAIEDPRLCRLLPLWRDLLAEAGHAPRFLLMARPADEVAASLRRRDAFAEAKSDLLWLEHQLAAERDTRGTRRAFLTYDGLLADWRGGVARIARTLGLDWDGAIAAAAPSIDAFLGPDLRRHRRGGDAAGRPVHPWLRATYLAWEEATEGTDPGPALAAIRDRLDSAGRLFFAWTDVLNLHARAEAGARRGVVANDLPKPVHGSAGGAVSKDPTPGNAFPVSS